MTIFIENASNSASNGTNTGDTFQRGIQNMSEKKMFPKTGISLFPSCSSADVCESVWYCTKDPLITVIGITATVFAITGCVANGLSVYRICTRKEHGSPTMTMITILSSSNSVSVIITYMPFLASFGHIADGVQSSLDFKIAAIISASAITISGFYVAQLSALRYLQLRYPLSSLKYITTKTVIFVSAIIFIVNLSICTSLQFSSGKIFPSTVPFADFKTRQIKKQILYTIPIILVIIFHILKKRAIQNTSRANAISQKMTRTVSMIIFIHVFSWIISLVPIILMFCFQRDKLHKMSHAIFYTTLLAWILHFGFIPVILVFRSNIKHPVRRNSSRYPLPVYGTNV